MPATSRPRTIEEAKAVCTLAQVLSLHDCRAHSQLREELREAVTTNAAFTTPNSAGVMSLARTAKTTSCRTIMEVVLPLVRLIPNTVALARPPPGIF